MSELEAMKQRAEKAEAERDQAIDTGRKWRNYCRSLTSDLNTLELGHPEVAEVFGNYQEAYDRGYENGKYFSRQKIQELESILAKKEGQP